MKAVRIALAGIVTLFTLFAQAQTADEIINKHIESVGGKDAWKKINSIKQWGSVKVQGNEVSLTITGLNGVGNRQDISVAGLTGYVIITPKAGWNYLPFNGQTKPETMTADDVKQGADDLDVQGNLLDYKAKGHTVEYLGKDDVDGTEAYKLKMTTKAGNVETLYIDPATNYVIRTVSKRKANGQEVDVTTNLSNYQKLPEGIVVPMSIGLPFGELKITKVEVNAPVDEAIFKPSN